MTVFRYTFAHGNACAANHKKAFPAGGKNISHDWRIVSDNNGDRSEMFWFYAIKNLKPMAELIIITVVSNAIIL